MRAPAIPLITIDPYFSVWAVDETLNYQETVHWTGSSNHITGEVIIDGEERLFLGGGIGTKKIKQTSIKIDALSTVATFENEKIILKVRFMTPLIPDDIKVLSRPVSFMEVSYESKDGKEHDVKVKVVVREEICLDRRGQSPVEFEQIALPGIPTVKMGNKEQKVLNRSGDDVRIDWGYFYLSCADENAEVRPCHGSFDYAYALCTLKFDSSTIFTFAYDDVYSINYFGKNLKSVWNNDGTTILQIIERSVHEYKYLNEYASKFSKDLYERAEKAGGKKYAEMVSLAYRQVIAAHKVVVDEDGEILFISKECSSNGCAATVDVSYPSTPLFLIYNPELAKGMLRPIYKFARSDDWNFEFAPHDVGTYPLLCGQVYGYDKEKKEYKFEKQMPVEECGNMIIMEANIALATKSADFAIPHLDLLEKWCQYLVKYGNDPENQLCTDDFAGHLAHNCNLSIKAILGIYAMGILYDMMDKKVDAENCYKVSKNMAKSWVERAKNSDGSFRLAFDKPNTFSMKYNLVWDKIWGSRIFSKLAVLFEFKSYFKHFEKYGLPLDSRCDYTKTDWLLWTATLADTRHDFEKFIDPLYKVLNETNSRIPFADIYDTISGYMGGMKHRSVQGGLFIKLLDYEEKLKIK